MPSRMAIGSIPTGTRHFCFRKGRNGGLSMGDTFTKVIGPGVRNAAVTGLRPVSGTTSKKSLSYNYLAGFAKDPTEPLTEYYLPFQRKID